MKSTLLEYGPKDVFQGARSYIEKVDYAIEKYDLIMLDKDLVRLELARNNLQCSTSE